MSARQNIFKSINTMNTFSDTAWLPNLSSKTSDILQRKLEELLNDTTSTSSSGPFYSGIDYLVPYTFRALLPKKGAKTNHAKCPPFYMQLDHTIAVLWHVFAHKDNERRKNIGLGQLQWALYFLKGIKDPLEGTRQADIDIAIKAIEDTLLECYAKMASIVMKKPQGKYESHVSSISVLSLPKRVAKIGTSASLGIMVKPRTSLYHIEDFNISSLSYTSLEIRPDISTTLEELIRFRNATQEKKLKFSPTQLEAVFSNQIDTNTDGQVADAYEMLKKLREDQVNKLSVEIENLRQLEEAANVKQSKWLNLNPQQLNYYEPFSDN